MLLLRDPGRRRRLGASVRAAVLVLPLVGPGLGVGPGEKDALVADPVDVHADHQGGAVGVTCGSDGNFRKSSERR